MAKKATPATSPKSKKDNKAVEAELDAIFAGEDAATVAVEPKGKKVKAKKVEKAEEDLLGDPKAKKAVKAKKVEKVEEEDLFAEPKAKKVDTRKLKSDANAVEAREGTIRAHLIKAFAKPTTVDAGVNAVLKTFTPPRSAAFAKNPYAFVKAHIGPYMAQGTLVEV